MTIHITTGRVIRLPAPRRRDHVLDAAKTLRLTVALKQLTACHAAWQTIRLGASRRGLQRASRRLDAATREVAAARRLTHEGPPHR
jgi:hypothetical protein